MRLEQLAPAGVNSMTQLCGELLSLIREKPRWSSPAMFFYPGQLSMRNWVESLPESNPGPLPQ